MASGTTNAAKNQMAPEALALIEPCISSSAHMLIEHQDRHVQSTAFTPWAIDNHLLEWRPLNFV
jgi:hypothetical protein